MQVAMIKCFLLNPE